MPDAPWSNQHADELCTWDHSAGNAWRAHQRFAFHAAWRSFDDCARSGHCRGAETWSSRSWNVDSSHSSWALVRRRGSHRKCRAEPWFQNLRHRAPPNGDLRGICRTHAASKQARSMAVSCSTRERRSCLSRGQDRANVRSQRCRGSGGARRAAVDRSELNKVWPSRVARCVCRGHLGVHATWHFGVRAEHADINAASASLVLHILLHRITRLWRWSRRLARASNHHL
mmetsp:Transcript_10913/g.24665  ORF Transcript_10913/g.24665 Transcript_10913/m.24665 type:complete len:228 (-) Transcript_10913:2307-2990(-)